MRNILQKKVKKRRQASRSLFPALLFSLLKWVSVTARLPPHVSINEEVARISIRRWVTDSIVISWLRRANRGWALPDNWISPVRRRRAVIDTRWNPVLLHENNCAYAHYVLPRYHYMRAEEWKRGTRQHGRERINHKAPAVCAVYANDTSCIRLYVCIIVVPILLENSPLPA